MSGRDLFLFIYIFLNISCTCYYAQTPTCRLVRSDEFSKDGMPDTSVWGFEKGFVRNHEDQWYQRENAYCKNGKLIIEAKRVHIKNPDYK